MHHSFWFYIDWGNINVFFSLWKSIVICKTAYYIAITKSVDIVHEIRWTLPCNQLNRARHFNSMVCLENGYLKNNRLPENYHATSVFTRQPRMINNLYLFLLISFQKLFLFVGDKHYWFSLVILIHKFICFAR